MLGKTDWYSAEKKIILTIALAILIASVSVFAILYLMMSHALQEDIRARARVVNAYAESHLNLEGFVHINTPKDMCEGAREMRISRTRNENVPEHFFCFGTFFELRFSGRGLRVRTDTKTRPFFSLQ